MRRSGCGSSHFVTSIIAPMTPPPAPLLLKDALPIGTRLEPL